MAPITIMLVIINLTGNTKARRLTMSAKKKNNSRISVPVGLRSAPTSNRWKEILITNAGCP